MRRHLLLLVACLGLASCSVEVSSLEGDGGAGVDATAAPGRDAGKPGRDASSAGLDAAEPGADAAQPGPDAGSAIDAGAVCSENDHKQEGACGDCGTQEWLCQGGQWVAQSCLGQGECGAGISESCGGACQSRSCDSSCHWGACTEDCGCVCQGACGTKQGCDCGGCASGTCLDNQCCTPSCSGKTCGDDGCGGICPPGCAGSCACQNNSCVWATQAPGWKVLLLVYPRTTIANLAGYGAVDVSMDDDDFRGAVLATAPNFPQIASSYTGGLVQVDLDIVVPPHPLGSLTKLDDASPPAYWATDGDISADLDAYASAGRYDSLVVHYIRKQVGSWGWGLALDGAEPRGMTWATVTDAPLSFWTCPDAGEPYLHEWLHGVCGWYRNKGVAMPAGDADGAGSAGYPKSGTCATNGYSGFYTDLMTGKVWDSATSAWTGIRPQDWQGGNLRDQAQVCVDLQATATTYWRTANATHYFFAAASGGMPPYAYAWDFGDGASSSAKHPTHQYASSASHAVVLTVTDALGRTATSSISVTP